MANLQDALRKFRTTGDFQDCLNALGVHSGRQPQFALQQALTEARTREERDTIEDISLVCSGKASLTLPTQVVLDQIVKKAEETYGSYIGRFVNIAPLVTGIYRSSDNPPPIEGIVAVIGIMAERAVGWTIPIEPNKQGQKLGFLTRDCKTCHGEGYTFCSKCLEKAYEILKGLPSYQRNKLVGSNDLLARELLWARAELFGCSTCHNEPAQACECSIEFSIPPRPKDGEILRGEYLQSGQDLFCCIRLQDV